MKKQFILSSRSRSKLIGVHPDLILVVEDAIKITEVDFAVLEGLRTIATQKKYVESGASWTMNGRHLTGHAVDLGAYLNGRISWAWPLYYKIADAMFESAKKNNIPLEWGGNWSRKKKDGPHFQLPWKEYPLEKK